MEETAATVGTKVFEATGDLFQIMNLSFDQIVDNPVLMLFLAGSLIGVGIGIFRGLRSAV